MFRLYSLFDIIKKPAICGIWWQCLLFDMFLQPDVTPEKFVVWCVFLFSWNRHFVSKLKYILQITNRKDYLQHGKEGKAPFHSTDIQSANDGCEDESSVDEVVSGALIWSIVEEDVDCERWLGSVDEFGWIFNEELK